MKRTLKVIGLSIGIVSILGLIYLYFLIREKQEYTDRVRKVAHVDIYLGEPINDLNSVDLNICSKTYHYDLSQIKDTVCENLGISDANFPCPVTFTYYINSGDKLILATDSFNCAGCSGTNDYILRKKTVEYEYRN